MNHVNQAIRLKEALDRLRPIKKEDELRIMQKFRLDWNYHSNHLEGNSLTFGETKALILFNITAQGKPLKDHIEVTGHDEAIKWVLDIVKKDRPLTENFIRELHKLILKEPYEVDAITPEGKPTKKTVNVGEYKTIPNHVRTRTGEIFRFATPEETPAKMKDLVGWLREKVKEEVNPILVAAEFHYRFIRIHPFDDGNGRTARILMNFILMQFGYPPVIIKTEDKENYYSVLEQADAGMLKPFIEYIANNLIRSLEIMIKGAKGESIEEPDDLEKEIVLLKQKLKEKGPQIEIVRSKEALEVLFEKDITQFVKKFIDYCKKFESFYLNISVVIQTNNSAKTINDLDNLDAILTAVKDSILNDAIYTEIECRFETINNTNVKPFDYHYRIKFQFFKTYYRIESQRSKWGIDKLYSETLLDPKLDSLLRKDAHEHTEYIKERSGLH